MNNITIHGRLTRDPESRDYKTSKGDSRTLCKFAVAVDRRFGEETDFFNCVIFGKGAEVIQKYFHRGSEIAVSGEMQCNPYEKDGVKKYPWTLNVSQFDFCGKKGDGKEQGETADPGDSFEQIDDDVPF